MSIKPEALAKVNNYRKLLFFVNVPLILGIPIALEFDLIDKAHSEKADGTYMTLMVADFFFTFNSLMIYSVIKRVCSSIEYLPEHHKIQIT